MRSKMLIVLTVLAACVLFVGPRVAAQDVKWVRLLHVETGKALGIEGESDEGAARAVLAKDGESKALQWKLEKDGDYYKLVNRKSTKVLDVFEESMDEGAAIIQWDDKPEGNDNQRWSWVGEGKDRRLKSKFSGMVLDVDAEGKVIQKKADETAKVQLFRVVEAKE